MSYEEAKARYAVLGVDTDKAMEILKANGQDCYLIGDIIENEDKIIIE